MRDITTSNASVCFQHKASCCLFSAELLVDTSVLFGLVICNVISVNVSISSANKLIQQLVCVCLNAYSAGWRECIFLLSEVS